MSKQLKRFCVVALCDDAAPDDRPARTWDVVDRAEKRCVANHSTRQAAREDMWERNRQERKAAT